MPINPAVVSAAISGGSSLLGGLLGYKSQKSANKTNLQIARETNEANIAMQRETNQQNLDIFNRQLEYNSPAEQRKMMEAAGYNPANLYSSGNSAIMAPNAPSLVAPHAERATIQPYLGFTQDIANIAPAVTALTTAAKTQEETKNLKLQNQVYLSMVEKQLESYGLQNEWQKIKNQYESEALPLNLDKLAKELNLTVEQANDIKVRRTLLETFGEREYEKKLDLLTQEAYKAKEEGLTELSKRQLNSALGSKAKSDVVRNEVQNWYQKNILDSERERNYKSARQSDAMAVSLDASTRVFKKFGEGEAAARILKMLKDGDYSEAATEKAWKEVKKLNKDIDWYEFHEAVDGLKVISNSFLGALFLAK